MSKQKENHSLYEPFKLILDIRAAKVCGPRMSYCEFVKPEHVHYASNT